ncbi:hypothetical protein SKAU_G00331020 [Synaphobranchus kaupii]|uniref:Protein S-acyltransferase n=1 Tax=Synaphobranchus kaupii TaxID=118154 RepID=A0A9Q1EL12_SYNKA|nr:hypothetical protein SKAU_G00331020 [Synaphobranchus kaupii]
MLGACAAELLDPWCCTVLELVVCFFSIWSILGLSGFHTYLVASNLTTNEDIKGSWSGKRGAVDSGNPYSYNNIFTNCCAILCGPMPPSLIDRRGFVLTDTPHAAPQEMEPPPLWAFLDPAPSSHTTPNLKPRPHSPLSAGQVLQVCAEWPLIGCACAGRRSCWKRPPACPSSQASVPQPRPRPRPRPHPPARTSSAPPPALRRPMDRLLRAAPANGPPSPGCAGRRARQPSDKLHPQRSRKHAALHAPNPVYDVATPPMTTSPTRLSSRCTEQWRVSRETGRLPGLSEVHYGIQGSGSTAITRHLAC